MALGLHDVGCCCSEGPWFVHVRAPGRGRAIGPRVNRTALSSAERDDDGGRIWESRLHVRVMRARGSVVRAALNMCPRDHMCL